MSATVVATEVAAYLAAVREALADLGAEERDDLLVEVEASLIDTAGEDDRPIAGRLGPPEAFAAELRASAGLPPAPLPAEPARSGLVAAMRAAVTEAAADRRVRALGRVLGELAPIWWLARAYVAVVVLAQIGGAHRSFSHPAIPQIGSGRIAAVILVLAVGASLALGLRGRRRPRADGPARSAVALNVVLALAALPVGAHLAAVASAPAPRDFSFVVPAAVAGLSHNGTPVRNVYPYTPDGRLLHDVLLYDDAGQPLDVNTGDVDPTRRVLTAADGQKIFNSFPIRYFAPGTTRVVNPQAAPPLQPPSLFVPATPRRPTARPAPARRSHH